MSDPDSVDFLSLPESDFRWPRLGDQPFVAPEAYNSPGYAELPVWQGAGVYFVVTGFMEAAQHLTTKALADRASRTALVLPILFCFRHSVETGLKRLLAEHGARHGVTCEKLTSTHDLEHLWDCFLRLMASTAGDADQDGIEGAGTVVAAFHHWDKGSIAFRYATTKNGERVAYPLDKIDLAKLSDTMTGFANFLMGVEGHLDALAEEGPL